MSINVIREQTAANSYDVTLEAAQSVTSLVNVIRKLSAINGLTFQDNDIIGSKAEDIQLFKQDSGDDLMTKGATLANVNVNGYSVDGVINLPVSYSNIGAKLIIFKSVGTNGGQPTPPSSTINFLSGIVENGNTFTNSSLVSKTILQASIGQLIVNQNPDFQFNSSTGQINLGAISDGDYSGQTISIFYK